MRERLNALIPHGLHDWSDELLLGLQLVAIVAAAIALRWLLRRLIQRLATRWELPPEVRVGGQRVVSFLIGFAALLLVLGLFGVSGGVLWTAITGFAAVSAIAFFAAWSVLTNIFCALLLLITRPFRLFDHLELLAAADRPGMRGKVVDMSLIYVTLKESHPQGGESVLRIPNSLFFQRTTRRWNGEPEKLEYPGSGRNDNSPPPPAAGGASALNFP